MNQVRTRQSVHHLLLYPPSSAGGVSSMIPAWIRWQRRHGWQSDAVYPPDGSSFGARASWQDWVQRYESQFDRIASMDQSIVHAHHPITALAFARWRKAQRLHLPMVLTIHGLVDLVPESLQISRAAMAAAQTTIAVSHGLAREMANRWQLRPDRVIYNGYDLHRFQPNPQQSLEIVRLVTVSRLVPEKGIDVVIRATARLRELGIPVITDIVGDGPDRVRLERIAKAYNIERIVVFRGESTAPEQWLRAGNVFALPTRLEAFGNAFVEANLCGLPTLGPPIGGIPEHLIHGYNGFLIPLNSPTALAETVRFLYRHPDLWLTMAQHAQRWGQRFSLDISGHQYLRLYADLAREASDVGQLSS